MSELQYWFLSFAGTGSVTALLFLLSSPEPKPGRLVVLTKAIGELCGPSFVTCVKSVVWLAFFLGVGAGAIRFFWYIYQPTERQLILGLFEGVAAFLIVAAVSATTLYTMCGILYLAHRTAPHNLVVTSGAISSICLVQLLLVRF